MSAADAASAKMTLKAKIVANHRVPSNLTKHPLNHIITQHIDPNSQLRKALWTKRIEERPRSLRLEKKMGRTRLAPTPSYWAILRTAVGHSERAVADLQIAFQIIYDARQILVATTTIR